MYLIFLIPRKNAILIDPTIRWEVNIEDYAKRNELTMEKIEYF